MAKSKNGGTRAYIRGRIGSDVYSVGKNGKGERQQVVRSLAESVANPRTSSQMFGRMVMSTVMQAVSALQPIIDHSFDGVAKGQPSISEFIRRNYALIKADATAHPGEGNKFGLNAYQEKGVKGGAYVVSVGNVLLPSAVTPLLAGLKISLTSETMTIGGLKNALGLSAEGYLTSVSIVDTGKAYFVRLRLNAALSDDTAITSENVASVFSQEGNIGASISISSTNIMIVPSSTDMAVAGGVIVSEKEAGSWVHNTCTLVTDGDVSLPADAALPTYPTGSEMFLNGGDL